MFISTILAALFYLAVILFLAGLTYKIVRYLSIPTNYLLAVAPVPRTQFGVVIRLVREILLFESLFRASKWTWLFAWIFHYSFAVVLLRHLFFVIEQPPVWVFWFFIPGDIAAWCMVVSLLGLLGRRLFVDRIRYISTGSDYALLILLLLIGATGLLLRYEFHTDLASVRLFMLGLLSIKPPALPQSPLFLIHFLGAVVLVAIVPYSKLLHTMANLFSPSHNQRYNTK